MFREGETAVRAAWGIAFMCATCFLALEGGDKSHRTNGGGDRHRERQTMPLLYPRVLDLVHLHGQALMHLVFQRGLECCSYD